MHPSLHPSLENQPAWLAPREEGSDCYSKMASWLATITLASILAACSATTGYGGYGHHDSRPHGGNFLLPCMNQLTNRVLVNEELVGALSQSTCTKSIIPARQQAVQ